MTDIIIAFINGISALALVCVALVLLFLFIVKFKGRIRYVGILLCGAIAFGWAGITITFLSVSLTGINQPWVRDVISYFSYSSIPVGAYSVMDTTWDVAGAPKNKKQVITAFIAYSIFYYIVLFVTFEQAVFISETGIIYDDWLLPSSLIYYILWGEVGLAAIISGIAWIKFRKKSPGELKKRSNYLLIASCLVAPGILLDTVILMEPHVLLLSIPRFIMIIGIILIYMGFRPSK